jgi:hypothetical protein
MKHREIPDIMLRIGEVVGITDLDLSYKTQQLLFHVLCFGVGFRQPRSQDLLL